MRMFIHTCFEFAHYQFGENGEIKTRVNTTCSTVYVFVTLLLVIGEINLFFNYGVVTFRLCILCDDILTVR